MIKINQNGDTSEEILRIKALHKGEYKDIQKIYDLNGNLIFKNYNEVSGIPPISFKSDGSNLLDYTIFGNTIQNSTPAPDTPIYSAGVGNPVNSGLHTGECEIPVISGNQTKNIYISQQLDKIGNYADEINYSTGKIIRRIKKLVLTGDDNFNWRRSPTRNYSWYFGPSNINAKQHFFYCSHGKTVYSEPSFVYGCVFVDSVLNFGIFDNYRQVSQVRSHLAAEYEKGTPVTIWYVLAEPEEESIEMPEISTIKGSNTIDVGTTVKPSKIDIKYKK